MKTLIIVRHAKSDWENEDIEDVLRPLSKRGYNDAKILSAELSKKIKVPAYWLTSSAIRAYSTALIYSRVMKYDPSGFIIEPSVYEASEQTLLKVIAGIPAKHNDAILFGHNPGLTRLFNHLSDKFADNIPTCGTMVLSAPVQTWEEFTRIKSTCNFYLYPKEFNT